MPEFTEYVPDLERQHRLILKFNAALNEEVALAQAAGEHPATCAEDSMRALAMTVAGAIATTCTDMAMVVHVAEGFGLMMARHFEMLATAPEGSVPQ